jgi:hypothetical protein
MAPSPPVLTMIYFHTGGAIAAIAAIAIRVQVPISEVAESSKRRVFGGLSPRMQRTTRRSHYSTAPVEMARDGGRPA